jgi:hypothetical protein
MSSAVKIFLALGVLSGTALAATWVLVQGLTPEGHHAQLRRWLLRWSLKGLLVPLPLWALMNYGLSWNLQPFMPQIQAAQNAGIDWVPVYLRVVASGCFVVVTYWTSVTLAWALYEAGAAVDGDTREQFKGLCATCFIAMIIPAVLVAYFGGWPLFGLAGLAVLIPMAGYGTTILHLKKTPPMYARAIARMKFGKYSEAEWEIIRELEKSEDDFDGWMMLATLYATNFNDLHEAEQTILEICEQPKTSPSQLAVALHQLANWHLQAGDPDAARRALHMICHRFPGSHLAHMAQLRINQLPGSAAELRQQKAASAIPMPALSDALDEQPATDESPGDRYKAAEDANACVEILKADPNNVPARERLARLLAERLDQPDGGIEQITLLLELPEQPEMRRAEWLGMIAAWHIRYRQDLDAGREVLQRLLREYPHAPQALFARRRLQLMDAQKKAGSA